MTEDKKAAGENSGKPEWFQLIDSDAPSAQVSRVNKKLPVIALIVTGVIAVSGTFFASASDSQSPASTSAISDVVDSNNTSEVTPSATTAISNSTVNPTSPVVPANGLQDPAQGGVTAPRGDHDDDEDRWGWLPGHDDHERHHERHHDEDHDDDDHEREERH